MDNLFHLTKTDNPSPYWIVQGGTYALSLRYHGDASAWDFQSQIRNNWADKDGSVVLAEFDFSQIPPATETIDIEGVPTLVTNIIGILEKEQTEDIPLLRLIRKSTKDAAIPGRNVYVYDLFGTDPTGDALRMIYGYVEISPRVTVP